MPSPHSSGATRMETSLGSSCLSNPAASPTSRLSRRATYHMAGHMNCRSWTSVYVASSGADGCSLAASGIHQDLLRRALRDAWDGTDPVDVGVGGSIPIADELHRRYPHATIAITGAADPRSRVHGPNESLHLDDFRRACLAETLMLSALSAQPRPIR